MNLQQIDNVNTEMKRLHKRIQELRRLVEAYIKGLKENGNNTDYLLKSNLSGVFNKEHAAVKRASMDLTRALVELRK